jgi:K319-like protein
VTLDGSGSYDPDGDPLTFAWSQVDGPAVTLAGGATAKPSFTANPVSQTVDLRFRLVVQDGTASSGPADVVVTLRQATFPPAANGNPGQQMGTDGIFRGELAVLGGGGAGTRFEIQASSNFVNWVTVGTNTLDFFQQIPFVDARSGQYRWRFYRAHQLARTVTQVYSNNFEGAIGPEWSLQVADVTPVGARRFLGRFGNGGPRLQLNGLPAHNRARLEFDFYLIQSWDGNDPTFGPDSFRVRVANGPSLLDATFACSISQATQTYPDAGALGNPPLTGAAEHGTLGYPFAGFAGVDAVYHFSFSFDHSDPTLAVDFTGNGLQELTDESWGLDNVIVTVEQNP